MINLYKTLVKGFDFPYFTAAFATKYGIERLKISKKSGIICPEFGVKCLECFEMFKKEFIYSVDSVEQYFGVEFSHLRIENGKIHSFHDVPTFGENIIYINKR